MPEGVNENVSTSESQWITNNGTNKKNLFFLTHELITKDILEKQMV